MSSEYHQCKAARATSLSFQTTAVNFDENIGKNDTVKFSPLSSLDCVGDTEILKTFRGTRMNSNNRAVNQNVSLSFDPSTLSCITMLMFTVFWKNRFSVSTVRMRNCPVYFTADLFS
jgi:hypothetical protein